MQRRPVPKKTKVAAVKIEVRNIVRGGDQTSRNVLDDVLE